MNSQTRQFIQDYFDITGRPISTMSVEEFKSLCDIGRPPSFQMPVQEIADTPKATTQSAISREITDFSHDGSHKVTDDNTIQLPQEPIKTKVTAIHENRSNHDKEDVKISNALQMLQSVKG